MNSYQYEQMKLQKRAAFWTNVAAILMVALVAALVWIAVQTMCNGRLADCVSGGQPTTSNSQPVVVPQQNPGSDQTETAVFAPMQQQPGTTAGQGIITNMVPVVPTAVVGQVQHDMAIDAPPVMGEFLHDCLEARRANRRSSPKCADAIRGMGSGR